MVTFLHYNIPPLLLYQKYHLYFVLVGVFLLIPADYAVTSLTSNIGTSQTITSLTSDIGASQTVTSCVRNAPCMCTTNFGKQVNLNLYDRPYSASSPNLDKYEWSPCKDLICAGFYSTACLQRSGLFYEIGQRPTEQFGVDPIKGLFVSYKDLYAVTTTKVFLRCLSTPTSMPQFAAQGELTQMTYEMSLSSHDFCFDDGGGGDDTPDESNTGTILVILFFVGLVLYFVVGIAVNHYYRKIDGLQMIPNLNFWVSLPGFIKDGFMFAFGKIFRRRPTGYEEKF